MIGRAKIKIEELSDAGQLAYAKDKYDLLDMLVSECRDEKDRSILVRMVKEAELFLDQQQTIKKENKK